LIVYDSTACREIGKKLGGIIKGWE